MCMRPKPLEKNGLCELAQTQAIDIKYIDRAPEHKNCGKIFSCCHYCFCAPLGAPLRSIVCLPSVKQLKFVLHLT